MTFLQKLVTTLLPASWSAGIKAESQSWLLRCPTCGTIRSLWDIGGMRYKATSRKKKALIWCRTCRQLHMMEMKQEPTS